MVRLRWETDASDEDIFHSPTPSLFQKAESALICRKNLQSHELREYDA